MRGELDDAYAIPLRVLQNERDCTVLQMAGRNLRDAQLLVFGDAAHDTPAEALAQSGAFMPVFGAAHACEHVRYTADGTSSSRSRGETVFYRGPVETPNTQDTDHGHYWIGGEQGRDGKWSVRRGPSYPDIVWDFFARHPREGSALPGRPQITLIGDNPLQLVRGQAFSDPGARASDPEDGPLPVSADCTALDLNRAGTYACTYRASDSAGNVAIATRKVIVSDPAAPPPDCPASACRRRSKSRRGARYSGMFNLRALGSGDRLDIGFAWDWWSRVTLYEGEPGRWLAAKPGACTP